jgi:hypothetical protein
MANVELFLLHATTPEKEHSGVQLSQLVCIYQHWDILLHQ